MSKERNGVSAPWLSCFLRECPAGTVVRGYEGEFSGLVVEAPSDGGEMTELAYIHNDCRVELTAAGQARGLPAADDLGVEI